MYELRNFITGNGKDIFDEWLDGLSDQRAHAAIMSRLDRLEFGAFGDVKSIGNGVRELRIDVGAGYRIYFAQRGKTILLLLCGGASAIAFFVATNTFQLVQAFGNALWFGAVVLWLFLLVKTWRGENWRVPLAGALATRLASK